MVWVWMSGAVVVHDKGGRSAWTVYAAFRPADHLLQLEGVLCLVICPWYPLHEQRRLQNAEVAHLHNSAV